MVDKSHAWKNEMSCVSFTFFTDFCLRENSSQYSTGQLKLGQKHTFSAIRRFGGKLLGNPSSCKLVGSRGGGDLREEKATSELIMQSSIPITFGSCYF